MSSITRNDDREDDQHMKNRQWLDEAASQIKDISVYSMEFVEIRWLLLNKEKIVGNKQIIDLLR